MSVTNSKNKAAKPSTSTRQLVPLDKRTVAGRFFNRMQRDIEADLGGRRQLSRIEQELIGAFCGASTALRYLNHELLLGESAELDLAGYATLASTMLRIGSRLGLRRVPRDMTPSLDQYLALKAQEQEAADGADRSLERDEQ